METVNDPDITTTDLPEHVPDFRELMEAYVAIFRSGDSDADWLHCVDLQDIVFDN